MKLLCFQAKHFRWKTHSKTLAEVADQDADEEVAHAVVIFVHAEKSDEEASRKNAVLRQTLKHIKWLANKEAPEHRHPLLTHLGGEPPPDFAEAS
jgi:hypothetical protein